MFVIFNADHMSCWVLGQESVRLLVPVHMARYIISQDVGKTRRLRALTRRLSVSLVFILHPLLDVPEHTYMATQRAETENL